MSHHLKPGAPLPELLPDPFTGPYAALQAHIAQVIQEDGAHIGAAFDDDFAIEIAGAILRALEYDEAGIDMLSLAFDRDVERTLAA